MKRVIKKFFASVILVILIIVAGGAFLIGFINLNFAGRVLPRVYLGSDSQTGLDYQSVRISIDQKVTDFNPKMILVYNNKSWTVSADEIDLNFYKEATARQIFNVGRDSSLLQSFFQQVHLIVYPIRVKAIFDVDRNKLAEAVTRIANEIDLSEKDASLAVEGGQVIEKQEFIGRQLDQEETQRKILEHLDKIEDVSLDLPVKILNPKVYQTGLTQAKLKLRRLVKANFYLEAPDQRFELSKDQIGEWFDFYATNIPAENGKGFLLGISLNQDRVKAYLVTLAQEIERSPVNAKLTIKDGRVTVFRPSKTGLELNREKALRLIEEALVGDAQSQIELPIEIQEPDVSNQKVNNLGIKEMIGQATTSFHGSPKNRVHNIKNGVYALSGILIKPEETFSVVAKLGEVNDKSGYLPELVIKKNRTVPEYGGGLCQVSTTLFRAAMDSGLPIVERQNHSYRVSYYEPPVGLDATVYLPKPDLKFRNDTQGYILIQGQVKGNNLTFEFYGTSDGRTVKIEGPYISNYTNPPESVYIETDTLSQGETKQIERAHRGASSVAYYKVYNKDGTERYSQTFRSKYKAWAAQYLVGIAQTAEGGGGEESSE